MIICRFRAFICAKYFEMDELKVSINETWCIARKCNGGFVGSSLILVLPSRVVHYLLCMHFFCSFVIQVVNVILTCAINVQKRSKAKAVNNPFSLRSSISIHQIGTFQKNNDQYAGPYFTQCSPPLYNPSKKKSCVGE